MPSFALAIGLALLLEATPSAPPAPPPLPRSSIAAVLAHRGELGLDDAEVKQLEERDAALQRQVAELRERLGATPARGRDDGGRPEGRSSRPESGPPPPLSPAAAARPEGFGGEGGHRGGGRGGHRPGGDGGAGAGKDPAARAAALQTQLDDADTAAWLAAEAVLQQSKREKARAVAEAYREALADQREAGRARR